MFNSTQEIQNCRNMSDLRAYVIQAGVVPAQSRNDLRQQAVVIFNGEQPEQTPAPAQPEQPEQPQPTPEQPQAAADLLAQAITLLSANNTAKLDENRVIELIHANATKQLTVELKQPTKEPVQVTNAHPKLPQLLKSIASSKITGGVPYLVGEAGTGKTTLAKQAAEALDLPFYLQSSTYDVFALLGFKNAQGEYMQTDFYRAWTEGGVMTFDELDGYSSECLTALNAAFENGVCAFPTGIKERHPDCVIIAAGNTDGRGSDAHIYNRATLDGATLDRLVKIDCPLDLDLMDSVVRNTTLQTCEIHGVDFCEAKYKQLHALWTKARQYVQSNELPFVVGLRDFRKMTTAHISEQLTLEEALGQTSISNLTKDQRIQAGI
jgi:tRNA A37 threonylcarbamoyladenosine biosynthesis protein TsaE